MVNPTLTHKETKHTKDQYVDTQEYWKYKDKKRASLITLNVREQQLKVNNKDS